MASKTKILPADAVLTLLSLQSLVNRATRLIADPQTMPGHYHTLRSTLLEAAGLALKVAKTLEGPRQPR